VKKKAAMHTTNMSKSMSVDCLLEQFLPNSLELSNIFNTLGAQVQNSIESPAVFISEVKQLTWGHVYRKHVSERDPNYIFGSRDVEKARNGKAEDQVQAVEWPPLPDGSTVSKQDQHSRDLRKLYRKFNLDSHDHRQDCIANNYGWLHPENIPAIVEAARQGLKGKQYREFCVKKSLEKLCRITGKPETFIEANCEKSLPQPEADC
jgi:hypothetical protein